MQVIVSINNKDLAGINHLPAEFSRGVEKGMKQAIIFAEERAKVDFTKSRSAAGGLHVRSGDLKRSIQKGISKSGDVVTAWLGSNMIYASTHEYGATIIPKKGKFLKFKGRDGNDVFMKKVVIPERKFLEPGITENINTITNIIVSNIVREANK